MTAKRQLEVVGSDRFQAHLEGHLFWFSRSPRCVSIFYELSKMLSPGMSRSVQGGRCYMRSLRIIAGVSVTFGISW